MVPLFISPVTAFFGLFLESESHYVVLVGLEFTIVDQTGPKLRGICLSVPLSASSKGVRHHIQLTLLLFFFWFRFFSLIEERISNIRKRFDREWT